MLDALRADQWLENHPEAMALQSQQIKQQLRDTFYVDTPLWRQQVLRQSFDPVAQAVIGLRGLCGKAT